MTSFERYFARCDVSRNWFDIVDPSVVGGIATVDIGHPEYLSDRQAIKAAFRAFGEVENRADGSRVVFPAASAGKMLYQSGVDIHGLAAAFKPLFETSVRVWNEREVPMAGHKFHFNVGSYRNYLNKFTDGKTEYYIRFTIREIGKDSAVHASTISEVVVYRKTEGALADSHPENPEDGHKAPFIDNKIAFYLSCVNGECRDRRPSPLFVAEALAWLGTVLAASCLATGLLGVANANHTERVILNSIWGVITAYHAVLALLVHLGVGKAVVILSACGWLSWHVCILAISSESGCRLADCFVIESVLAVVFLLPCLLMYLPQSGRWLRSRRGNC